MIYAIYPYKDNGFWVFDDPSKGLEKEGLVLGIDVMLDLLTQNKTGIITLTVSDEPIAGGMVLDYQGEGSVDGDDWSLYWSRDLKQEGWLCPNFKKYFPVPPAKLYFSLS